MAEFIADMELLSDINTLISTANRYVFIMSPYIDMDSDTRKVLSDLEDAVKKIIIHRPAGENQQKSGVSDDSRQFLNSLSNVEFISVKNLHAKIYLNESIAILGSMNLTNSSRHNSEVGMLFERYKDIELYSQCNGYILFVIQSKYSDLSEERFQNIIPKLPFTLEVSGQKVNINGQDISAPEFKALLKNCNVKHGYCIRCQSTEIQFNPSFPFCPSCYKIWQNYKNPNHEEKFCHRCGMPSLVHINESMCEECLVVFDFEIEREWKKIKDKT